MATCTGASGRTGTKYTYAQLEGLWINAGGSKALAPVMAAIAEAESSGCSAAYNPSGASGLWQVEPSNAQYVPGGYGNIFNPADNAKAAVGVYKAQGLDAWQTYTSGAYKAFLAAGTTPDTSVPGSSTAQTTSATQGNPSTCVILVPNPVSGIPLIGDLITSGGICLFTKTEARALIGGLILAAGCTTTVVGLAVLMASALSHTKAGQAAGRVAEGAGAGLALVPGMELAGGAIAAAGHAAKGKKGPGRAATAARGRARDASAEDAYLQGTGASDIKTARKPPGTLRKSAKPGVKTGSISASGETSRERSRRMASPAPSGRHARREPVPF